VFWNRAGTPTATEQGGAIEEVKWSIGNGLPTMIYRSRLPVDVAGVDFAQAERLRSFFDDYLAAISYVTEYHSLDGFKLQLQSDLSKLATTLRGSDSSREDRGGGGKGRKQEQTPPYDVSRRSANRVTIECHDSPMGRRLARRLEARAIRSGAGLVEKCSTFVFALERGYFASEFEGVVEGVLSPQASE